MARHFRLRSKVGIALALATTSFAAPIIAPRDDGVDSGSDDSASEDSGGDDADSESDNSASDNDSGSDSDDDFVPLSNTTNLAKTQTSLPVNVALFLPAPKKFEIAERSPQADVVAPQVEDLPSDESESGESGDESAESDEGEDSPDEEEASSISKAGDAKPTEIASSNSSTLPSPPISSSTTSLETTQAAQSTSSTFTSSTRDSASSAEEIANSQIETSVTETSSSSKGSSTVTLRTLSVSLAEPTASPVIMDGTITSALPAMSASSQATSAPASIAADNISNFNHSDKHMSKGVMAAVITCSLLGALGIMLGLIIYKKRQKTRLRRAWADKWLGPRQSATDFDTVTPWNPDMTETGRHGSRV